MLHDLDECIFALGKIGKTTKVNDYLADIMSILFAFVLVCLISSILYLRIAVISGHIACSSSLDINVNHVKEESV